MSNSAESRGCPHQVARIGSLAVTQEEFGQAARAFYLKVADFNIRGGFDQVEHPGFLSEFEFCPQCGGKLNSKINRDELLLEAIQSYDCKGRANLEAQKAKEIRAFEKSIL